MITIKCKWSKCENECDTEKGFANYHPFCSKKCMSLWCESDMNYKGDPYNDLNDMYNQEINVTFNMKKPCIRHSFSDDSNYIRTKLDKI